jgi:hypothetical protein
LALLLILGGGCAYDHGLDPVPSRIKGTIIFQGGPPPYYVREARIVVAKNVPPENFTTDVIFSDPLPFNRDSSHTGPDSVHYEMVVEPGVYTITAILWRQESQSWNIGNIIGLYGVDFARFEFAPKEIVINNDQLIADSVDIPAYWDLTSATPVLPARFTLKTSKIPARTRITLCSAFIRNSAQQLDYLSFQSFQFILQRTPVASYSYSTPVSSGKYKFIALFWKGKTTSLNEIKAIGFYQCPNNEKWPNSVSAAAGTPVNNIDFEADFSTLPFGIRFEPIENCGQP